MLRRLAATFVFAMSLLVVAPAPAVAHGIGGRADLPVPLSYFAIGASAAVVISFMALAVLWPNARLQEAPTLRRIGDRWMAIILESMPVFGLVGLVLVIGDGLIGGNVSTRHISPVVVWVVFWLVFPYLVALIGNVWLWMSPWRTLGNWINSTALERPDLMTRLGIWPATLGFMGFVWLELVSPTSSDPGTLATAALVYTLYLAAMTRVMGVDAGLASGDAFENYFAVLAAIAPIELSRSRPAVGTATTLAAPTVSWRGWLRGLPHLPQPRGMTWFIVAMIGSVTYDGLSSTGWWGESFGDAAGTQWFGTLALVAIIATIGAGYHLAAGAAAKLASGSGESTRTIAKSFIHTLVPIALAYAFAHYFTLVLFEGQQLIHAASDPFGLGWNLFGTADWRIVFFLSPTVVWWIQLVTIVAGHIAATMLAHDRALHQFGAEVAVRTQYAMLVLMVALTSLGLFILAG